MARTPNEKIHAPSVRKSLKIAQRIEILFLDRFLSVFFFGVSRFNNVLTQEVDPFGDLEDFVDRRSDVYNFGGRSATIVLPNRMLLDSFYN